MFGRNRRNPADHQHCHHAHHHAAEPVAAQKGRFGKLKAQHNRQNSERRRSRSRHADKKVLPVNRLRLIFQHGVETRQTHRHADGKQQTEKPAEFRKAGQRPLIHQNGRRHPETDEVGKRIQFGAEFGRSFEHARHATVQHVKKGSQKNADDGFSPQSHNRITHGSDAGAQSQRGDDIGGDFAKRQRSQFLLQQIVVEFFHYLITPLTAAADDERLAITVSPAVMI